MKVRQIFTADEAEMEKSAGMTYRLCPMCGAPLLPEILQQAEGSGGAVRHAPIAGRQVCGECGWKHYRNPAPCVVMLIVDQGRVLLTRRAPGSVAGGKWCLPGGYIEFEEDFLSAALREAKEETNLDIEIRSILSVVSNFLSSPLHTLVVVLLAEIAGGEPTPGDDAVEAQWFALSSRLPEMAFEADAHIIKRYHKTELRGVPVDPEYARRAADPASSFQRRACDPHCE